MQIYKTVKMLLQSACCIGLVVLSAGSMAGTDVRPMVINSVGPLGLKIWTEAVPRWPKELTEHRGVQVFTAWAPDDYYPPARMSWAVMPFKETGGKEQLFLQGVLQQALQNYRSSLHPEDIDLQAADYGNLSGWMAEFGGFDEQQPVDVRFLSGVSWANPGWSCRYIQLPESCHI
ncbi:hypothetical protein [Aliamphritea spongicola]|nr:hypothetical protein [Aliamphritea spongicola]